MLGIVNMFQTSTPRKKKKIAGELAEYEKKTLKEKQNLKTLIKSTIDKILPGLKFCFEAMKNIVSTF